MALSQISDVIVPSIFADYVSEQSVQMNKLVSSGLVVVNPVMSAWLAGGGIVESFPSFKNIDASDTAALVPTDNDATIATAEKIESSKQVAIRMKRNKVWSAASLAGQLAGADPMLSAAQNVGSAQNKIRQSSLLSVLAGTINETKAANLVNTIALETTVGLADTNKFSGGALIDTLAGWGDNASDSGGLFIHSDTYRAMQKANLVEYQATNAQNIGFGTYLGFTLLVDDKAPKRAGTTSGTVYTSYIVRPGAIHLGSTVTSDAIELYRAPLAGNSGGVDSLIVRDTFSYHVEGFAWSGSAAALPDDTALSTAANWTKAFTDKQIGVAALVHNL